MTRWVFGSWSALALFGCGGATEGRPSGDTATFFHRIEPPAEQLAAADLESASFFVGVDGATSDGRVVVGRSLVDFVAADGTVQSSQAAFRWTAKTGTVALGELPGVANNGVPTTVLAMTPDASVLVGATASVRAFRWTESDGMMDVTPAGAQTASAFLVSDDGSVVAGQSDSGPFRWTERGGAVHLRTLATYYGALPYVMSRDGSVVAGMVSGGEPFVWTEATGMTSAGSLSDCDSFEAFWATGLPPSYGAVMAGICSRFEGSRHAFVWTEAKGLRRVDFGSETDDSFPHAVSADGSVVVGHVATGAGPSSLVRWTEASGSGEALASPVEFQTTGLARLTMSADGSVVVGNGTTGSFQWSSGTFRLEPLAGDDETYVSGVSADGRTVAGVSMGPSGSEAVVWISGVPVRVAELLSENELLPSAPGLFSSAVAGQRGEVLYGNEIRGADRVVGWIARFPTPRK